MVQHAFRHLQQVALQTAARLPLPAFVLRFREELGRSSAALAEDALVQQCRVHLDESLLECAHGLCHCESVARDAGALVLIEAEARGIPAAEREGLFIAGILAGLLHDIKRREDNHALLGSIEAERILAAVGLPGPDRGRISGAIRNHEAFKAAETAGDRAGQLVSDALYDADKFRWGPENFTITLWRMVEDRNTPLEALHRMFREKMKGIERIKSTFRTGTGIRFGPEFIDQGITIGNRIYDELCALLAGETRGSG